MRDIIKAFVGVVSETLPIAEPVYEFGSLQVPEQVGYADLRPYFVGKRYIGADMREGPGVDVLLNLHELDLPDESIGTALCLDTLEHVEYPHLACREMWRVLRPGGICVISSHMNFPIHDYPSDYWRFTPAAFASLLKLFSQVYTGYVGAPTFPHTVLGIGVKGGTVDWSEFRKRWR